MTKGTWALLLPAVGFLAGIIGAFYCILGTLIAFVVPAAIIFCCGIWVFVSHSHSSSIIACITLMMTAIGMLVGVMVAHFSLVLSSI